MITGTLAKRKGEWMRLPLFCLIWLAAISLSAQTADSPADSAENRPERVVTPRGAVLRSAILPGWGQWYNDQKWKAPIVLGIELGLGGAAVYYGQLAARSDDVYDKDWYEYLSSQFIVWTVAVYLLNLIDAYVDANLYYFDTGPELALSGMNRQRGMRVAFRIPF